MNLSIVSIATIALRSFSLDGVLSAVVGMLQLTSIAFFRSTSPMQKSSQQSGEKLMKKKNNKYREKAKLVYGFFQKICRGVATSSHVIRN